MSAAHFAQRLDRLRIFLRTNPAGLAIEDVQAIASCLDRYFSQRCSLDAAMGVHLDQGENHPGETSATATRNAHLCAAARQLGELGRKNSELLAEKFAVYERRGWKRDRTAKVCPSYLSQIEAHFWEALKAWPRLIGGKQMYQIVEESLEVKPRF